MAEPYRLAVIGGGAGGLVTAAGAALFGARTALLEKREALGGDCLLEGCVPSKAFIRAARAAHAVRTAGRYGVAARACDVDYRAVMAYVHGAIATLAVHDDPARFRGMGVDVRLGQGARFLAPGRLRVGGDELRARHVVIATGTRPAPLEIPGIGECEWYDTESLWHRMTALPARLVVVGGGPIGCELGQAFARLGSRVTIVQRGPRLLPKEEPEAALAIADALRAEGVDVRLGTRPVAGRAGVLVLEGPDGACVEVPFDAVLVATGRRPNVEALDLAVAGVALDARGFVAVDAAMRTSARGVLAVGDVAGRMQFTHVAEAEAKVALRTALFPFPGRMAYDVVPWATFTDPEVGRVGAAEADLVAAGTPHVVHTFAFADVDRAVTEGEPRGFVKILATPRGRVLGATVVASHGGELIHELALAMRRGVPLSGLSGLIHAYPTWSLGTRRAADGFMRAKLDGLAGRVLRGWVRMGW